MSSEPKPFDVKSAFVAEAEEIIAAREVGRLIHGSGDIDASGDEVEVSVRRVIRRKLRQSYYVGHGQIVDSTQTLSGELDVVIADNTIDPVLFQAGGTEYFFYESVYAVGEVKATLRAEKQVSKFVDDLARIRCLHRQPDTHLFSFMMFPSSEGFALKDLDAFYLSRPTDDLPNMICVLDEGVLTHAQYSRNAKHQILPTEFSIWPTAAAAGESGWLTILNDSIGANFAIFYYLLNAHLRQISLQTPNLTPYLVEFLTKVRAYVFVPKNDPSGGTTP